MNDETRRVLPAPVDADAVASEPLAIEVAFAARYELTDPLGKGGMGEVVSCHDRRLMRDVALKLLLPDHAGAPELETRFVREARVQGQLDHPAVVPVHDLGAMPDGRLFFTMKRIRGVTLRQIFAELAAGHAAMRERYSRRKLLTAFSTICQGIDFAHHRGIVHRDIKPSNVMLGGFGEVYILDWGVAGVPGLPELSGSSSSDETDGALTTAGAVIGTPRYMAPEQKEGRATPQSDVYALGVVLQELLAATAGDDATPPELAAIAERARAIDPAERFPSAAELHAEIERFLDGDRDLELRRRMSDQLTDEAEAVLARALAASVEERRRVLRQVGRALAFDPENARALRMLVRLLSEPPREVPPEVQAEFEADRQKRAKHDTTVGAIAFLAVYAAFPLVWWMGIQSWSSLALMAAVGAVALFTMLGNGRLWSATGSQWLPLVCTNVALSFLSLALGPFLIIPPLIVLNSGAFVMYFGGWRWRVAVAASGIAAAVVPVVLELGGFISPSYRVADGSFCILPRTFAYPATPTIVLLLAASAAMVVGATYYFSAYARMRHEAEQRLRLHVWQLGQMVRDESR